MSHNSLKTRSNVEERRFSAASSIMEDVDFSPRGRTFCATTFAVIALLALASIYAQAQKPATPTADLPAGPMQAKATTACLECHEARIILQQRLSKGAWTKEVDKMTKWGALVDPADRDALIDYLSTQLQPRQAPLRPTPNRSFRKDEVEAPWTRKESHEYPEVLEEFTRA